MTAAIDTAYSLLEGGDPGRAVAELERAGASGDAQSLLELAVWLLDGRHIPRDLAYSRSCFLRSGDLGNISASHVYICFLANGVGGPSEWQAAIDRLTKLATHDAGAARQIGLVQSMQLNPQGYPLTRPERRVFSDSPEAYAFDDFFTPAECAYLIDVAKPLLQQSVIVDPLSGEQRPNPVRTSDGAMFPWVSENLVISALNRRIAAASGTDAKCGEPLQVLRYQPGQEYRPHLDALPAAANQRVLTMLVYLNSDFRGGETQFTRSQLEFAPRSGAALLFRNAQPGSPPDRNSEHAGLPVVAGEKFLASRWIRERPMFAG